MKNITLKLSVCIVMILSLYSCGGNGTNNEKPSNVTTEEKKTDADSKIVKEEEGNLPIVVDFYATWCGPCKALSPLVEKAAEKYAGKVEFHKVDVDQEAELSQEYNVESLPTLIYFDSEGNEIDRTIGYIDAQELDSRIQQLIK